MKNLTQKEFLQRLKEKNEHFRNGEFEVVGEYVNYKSKILCRTKYGECYISSRNLLDNRNCSILTATDKTNYWINMAREVHGDRYDYSEVDYVNSYTKVIIICPEHGEFKQKPSSHLTGRGCDRCIKNRNVFSLSQWCEMCGDNPGIFYILRCWNDDEEFFKIGITCMSVDKRYAGSKLPYNYEIVNYIESEDRKYIWNLEKKYKQLLKNFKYEPKIKFHGSKNECFKILDTNSI